MGVSEYAKQRMQHTDKYKPFDQSLQTAQTVMQGPVSWWGWSLYCDRCEVGDGSALWDLGESHVFYCWVL